MTMRTLLFMLAFLAGGAASAATVFTAGTAQSQDAAIVVTDAAVLRAAPRDSAQQQAQLHQGDLVEVRGERLDFLQVWDHERERGGFVRASQVRRTALQPQEAPGLLAVVRFLREAPGAESLGIAYAAAWLRAAAAGSLRGADGIEVLDALGTMADRLAQRASSGTGLGRNAQALLAAHLDVAARYGVHFVTHEQDGRVQVCYDGDAFRRVLAAQATPLQQAHAALALTRGECVMVADQPDKRHPVDEQRADVLEQVDTAALPGWLRSRVQMRRAQVWAAIAYERARLGGDAQAAAARALAEFAAVHRTDLADDDRAAYNDTAMRVGASRWAVQPPVPPVAHGLSIMTVAGVPGETCVLLVDGTHDEHHPLARRCTYALVWPQSASVNREGNAVALAVQPLQAWRELWVFRKRAGAWAVDVIPPGSVDPALGYAEFAGWVPGGRSMLVAREARGEGRWRHSFEVVSLDSLVAMRQSDDAAQLGSFRRWQDPAWKRMTVSMR